LPITFSNDRYGSFLTRGVGDILYERARRVKLVRGLTNGNFTLNDAAQEFINVNGLFHHVRTTLPLQRVTVNRFGPEKVYLQADYHRRRIYGTFTTPSFALARFRGSMRSVSWIRDTETFSDGLPSGDIHFHFQSSATENPISDPQAVPREWVWNQPAAVIIVETLLNSSPLATIAGRLGKVNSNAVVAGGFSFPPLSVLFKDYQIDPIEQADGSFKWFVRYIFVVVNGGYYRQHPVFNINAGPPAWETANTVEYETSSFAGGFPV